MAYEVSRRNFLKGAAAMTVAAAASTLLAGCDGNGGSPAPAANEIVLGDYRVKVTDAKTTQEGSMNAEKLVGYITPVVSVSYSGKGSPTFLYNEIFTSATIGEAKMTLTNPLQPYNSIVGTFISCEPKFKMTDKETYLSYTGSKAPLILKVSFDDKTYAVFEIWNNGTIKASKV